MLIKGLIFLKLLLFLAGQSSAIDPDALIYPGDPRYKLVLKIHFNYSEYKT